MRVRPVMLVCLLVAAGCREEKGRLWVAAEPQAVPADGFSTARVLFEADRAIPKSFSVEIAEGQRRGSIAAVNVTAKRAEVLVRVGVLSGPLAITARAPRFSSVSTRITLTPVNHDSDADGMPDVLLLHDEADRTAFRRWFTFLAEWQFFADALPREIDDCAALLRFAYREALRGHDSEWAALLDLRHAPNLPAARKYRYPYTPLGAALFRVKPGRFAPDDIAAGRFAQFADAETLMRRNTWLVSRDVGRAEPGDLLFYRQIEQNLPFHAMIYLGPSQVEPDPQPRVVYHTGPVGDWPGEVRRPTIDELLRHPSPRWRPHTGNTNFLGIFRWNILRNTV